MTEKDLKNALLQEAVQGKLVPQISSEGNARDLLEEIRKEKAKLVKEGKLKKEKPLPEITEEDIPFDIPENWSWCRLSQCCVRIFSGKSPSYSKTPTKHIIIGQQANQWEQIEMQYAKFGTDDHAKNIEEYQYLLDGDVLLNTLGNGTLGRCGIFEKISDKEIGRAHV